MASYFLLLITFGFALIKKLSNGEGLPMHWWITWIITLVFSVLATYMLGI